MVSGYIESVSSSTFLMYSFVPFASARIAAIPIMPIEPANAVISVRPFLVMRLLNERPSAVRSDIEVLREGLASRRATLATSNGSESAVTWPSANSTIRVAYWWASSGLCVTIITRRSCATSLSKSITCTEVDESSAPVGSSASRISGSFTRARAIATRCICPPES